MPRYNPQRRPFDPFGLAQRDPGSLVGGVVGEEPITPGPARRMPMPVPVQEPEPTHEPENLKDIVPGSYDYEPQPQISFGEGGDFLGPKEFVNDGSIVFNQGGVVDLTEALSKEDRRQATLGFRDALNGSAGLWGNAPLALMQKTMVNSLHQDGWDDITVSYPDEEMTLEYDRLTDEEKEQYATMSKSYRSRMVKANSPWASHEFGELQLKDKADSWKQAFADVSYLHTTDDREFADGMMDWMRAQGGASAQNAERMFQWYRAQSYADKFRQAWEAEGAPVSGDILYRESLKYFPGYTEELVARGPGGRPITVKDRGGPLRSDQQGYAMLLRQMAEAKAEEAGVTYEKYGGMPLDTAAAHEMLGEAFAMWQEVRNQGLIGKSESAGQMPEGGFSSGPSTVESFVTILDSFNIDYFGKGHESAKINDVVDILGASANGDIHDIHEANGRVSIGGAALHALTMFSKMSGTWLDSMAYDRKTVGYATRGGIFTNFWEALHWSVREHRRNPNAVWQEDKDLYSKKNDDERAMSSYTAIGQGWDKMRGFSPDYEEHQFPVKPTRLGGIEFAGATGWARAWEAAGDAWDAKWDDSKGVYFSQALAKVIAPNLDPSDGVGKFGIGTLAIGLDILGDPLTPMTGGLPRAAAVLQRKVHLVEKLAKAGWAGRVTEALAPLTPRNLANGTGLTARAAGLLDIKNLSSLYKRASQMAKNLKKLKPWKARTFGQKINPFGAKAKPYIIVQESTSPTAAGVAMQSVGKKEWANVGKKAQRELVNVEPGDVYRVFRSKDDALRAAKSEALDVSRVVKFEPPLHSTRVLGRSNLPGGGEIIVDTGLGKTAFFGGGTRRVTLDDGTTLASEEVAKYEIVRDVFRGNDEFARWFYTAVKNNKGFMKDGFRAIISDSNTLKKVHRLMKNSGVLVGNADDTAQLLTALDKPLQEIIALKGTGLGRARSFMRGGFGLAGEDVAWTAQFEHARQIKLSKLTSALATDPILGAVRVMAGKGLYPVGRAARKKLLALAPERRINVKGLMKFTSQAWKDSMGVAQSSGLIGLDAHRFHQVPMESASSIAIGSAVAVGYRFEETVQRVAKLATAARQTVELSPALSEAVKFHRLSQAGIEGYIQSQFARWALTTKGYGLGGTEAGAKAIYTNLAYMVDMAETFDKGIQSLAFVQKIKYGGVEIKVGEKAGKDVMLKIDLESLRGMDPGTRELAMAEVATKVDADDIDRVRRVMDPYRQNFKDLRTTLDEMGRTGEEAGLHTFQEKYAPHFYRDFEAVGVIAKAQTDGWDVALKGHRGSVQNSTLSGHGISRQGPPTLIEAEVFGFDPVLDMREAFHMRSESFIMDIHNVRLLTAFAEESGIKATTSISAAETLIRDGGKLRSLDDVGAALEESARIVTQSGEAVRATNLDIRTSEKAVNKTVKSMGLSEKDIGMLISDDTFEEIVEKLAGEYSNNFSGPRAEFLKRGPGHVKIDAFYRRLINEGALTEDGAELLREIYKDVDSDVLYAHDYYASLREWNEENAKLGRPKKRVRPNIMGWYHPSEHHIVMVTENYGKGGGSLNATMSTLVHEFGHLAHNTILTAEELNSLEIIGRKLAKSTSSRGPGPPTARGLASDAPPVPLGIDPRTYGPDAVKPIRDYFDKGISGKLEKSYTDYYIGATQNDAPFEWFAQGLVEHIYGGHSSLAKQFPELERIYDRLGAVVGKAMDSLKGRTQPALFDAMRPYMDKFTEGQGINWKGFMADISTVPKGEIQPFIESRLAYLAELRAKGSGHEMFEPQFGRNYRLTVYRDILHSIPKGEHVAAKAVLDKIVEGKVSPESFWDHRFGVTLAETDKGRTPYSTFTSAYKDGATGRKVGEVTFVRDGLVGHDGAKKSWFIERDGARFPQPYDTFKDALDAARIHEMNRHIAEFGSVFPEHAIRESDTLYRYGPVELKRINKGKGVGEWKIANEVEVPLPGGEGSVVVSDAAVRDGAMHTSHESLVEEIKLALGHKDNAAKGSFWREHFNGQKDAGLVVNYGVKGGSKGSFEVFEAVWTKEGKPLAGAWSKSKDGRYTITAVDGYPDFNNVVVRVWDGSDLGREAHLPASLFTMKYTGKGDFGKALKDYLEVKFPDAYGTGKSPSHLHEGFFGEAKGAPTAGHHIQKSHQSRVESSLRTSKSRMRQSVMEDYPELAKQYGYKVESGAAAAARVDAEAVRDTILAIDKKRQEVLLLAAKVSKDLSISKEVALEMLEKLPQSSKESLMRRMGAAKKGREGALSRARKAEGPERASELAKAKAYKKDYEKAVEHDLMMQELKKQMQETAITREEQSMVTMALWNVPSIDYLSYKEARKFLAEGKVSLRSILETDGKTMSREPANAYKNLKNDRVFGKHYVPVIDREKFAFAKFSQDAKDSGNGGWIVTDKAGKELSQHHTQAGAMTYINETMEVPEWARQIDKVWIPVEYALVLQKLGTKHGFGGVEKTVRAGLMQSLISASKALRAEQLTGPYKGYLTSLSPAMHFGRRNQLDAISKIIQHSGAGAFHPEIIQEYLAFMRGELRMIDQATGGFVDASKAKREMEMLLFNSWEDRVNVKKLLEQRLSRNLTGNLTSAQRIEQMTKTPGAEVGVKIKRTGAASKATGVFGTKVQRSSVAGLGIAMGHPEVALAAGVGHAGTTGGRLPTIQEIIFPWGPHATEATDNALRSYLYFMELKTGSGIKQGLTNALDYARNYTNLTEFEKYFVAQGPVLFWNFAKQNLKSTLRVLGDHPGRLSFWPKIRQYINDDVAEEFRPTWGNDMDMMYTKKGTWFLPLDLGGLSIFDPIATIVAGGLRAAAGQKEALSRALSEAADLALPQSSQLAHAFISGLSEDGDELGSSKISYDTQRAMFELLNPGPSNEASTHHFAGTMKTYIDKEGRPRTEFVGPGSFAYKMISFAIPLAQIGNNWTRPAALEAKGETQRYWTDVLGMAKHYPFDHRGDIFAKAEIMEDSLKRIAGAVDALVYNEGLLDIGNAGQLTEGELAALEALGKDTQWAKNMTKDLRDFLKVPPDPYTLKDETDG